MIEATTNPAARAAMSTAHAARGQMMSDFFAWLRAPMRCKQNAGSFRVSGFSAG